MKDFITIGMCWRDKLIISIFIEFVCKFNGESQSKLAEQLGIKH